MVEDAHRGCVPSGRMERALAWIPCRQRLLLDIGCGPLKGDSLYCSMCDEVIALDIERTHLTGKGRTDRTHLLVADGTVLPFIGESVDTVAATEVLEHVSSDVSMISEVRRVLKPGGRLILTVPNAGPLDFLDPNHFSPARAVVKLIGKKPQTVHRHYSLEEVAQLLGDDFRLETVSRTGCWATGICVLLVQLSKLIGSRKLERLFNLIGSHDYRLEYGAGAYNLALSATKVKRRP